MRLSSSKPSGRRRGYVLKDSTRPTDRDHPTVRSASTDQRQGLQHAARQRGSRSSASGVYGRAPPISPALASRVETLELAQGMTNKQVAYALGISEQTVKNHMSSILRKLSVNDRTQAVVYAMRQGWIKIPED